LLRHDGINPALHYSRARHCPISHIRCA
jgi:hypothetical protein